MTPEAPPALHTHACSPAPIWTPTQAHTENTFFKFQYLNAEAGELKFKASLGYRGFETILVYIATSFSFFSKLLIDGQIGVGDMAQ